MRGVLRPIGDVVGVSCVVGMFGYSLGSLGRQFQRVDEAAFGQLDLEVISLYGVTVTQVGF
jgi:hypothetical protein